MIMKWEDLMPGDKVRFSLDYEDLTCSWKSGKSIKTITKVIVGSKITLYYTWGYGTFTTNITINRDGTYMYSKNPLFEIVELAGD